MSATRVCGMMKRLVIEGFWLIRLEPVPGHGFGVEPAEDRESWKGDPEWRIWVADPAMPQLLLDPQSLGETNQVAVHEGMQMFYKWAETQK